VLISATMIAHAEVNSWSQLLTWLLVHEGRLISSKNRAGTFRAMCAIRHRKLRLRHV